MLTLCQETTTRISPVHAPLPVMQGAAAMALNGSTQDVPAPRNKSLHNDSVRPNPDFPSIIDWLKDQEKLWDIATAWVDQNKGLIIHVSDQYLHRGPYERSDFVNAACLASFEALESCVAKGELQKFRGYFFIIFRRRCLEDFGLQKSVIITSHNRTDLETCPLPSDAFHPLKTLLEERSCDDEMELFKNALPQMTRRQQRAWSILLGFEAVGLKDLSQASVARYLGISEKGLQRLLRRSLARLSRKSFSPHQKLSSNKHQNVPCPSSSLSEDLKRQDFSRSIR